MPNPQNVYTTEYFLSFPDPILARKFLKFSEYPEDKKINEQELTQQIAERIYDYKTGKLPSYYQGEHLPVVFKRYTTSAEGHAHIQQVKLELKLCFAYLKSWVKQAAITVLDSNQQPQTAESALDDFIMHLETGFFSDKTVLFYADGKKYIETIAILVHDNSIGLTFRKNQIIALTMDNHLAHCADGCFSRFATIAQVLREYGDFTPASLIKKFINKLASETTSKFSILSKRANSYAEKICQALKLPIDGNEIHAVNYLLTHLKLDLRLKPLHIPADEYVQIFEKHFTAHAIIHEVVKLNYLCYQEQFKKGITVTDLVSFIREQYHASFQESLREANFDDWINLLRGSLEQLGSDPGFSIHEVLSTEENNNFALKNAGLATTIVERLLANQWLENPLKPGSRFFDKRQMYNLHFERNTPLPENEDGIAYRIFIGNFALSWVKIDNNRISMVDLIRKPGGLAQLKEILQENQLHILLENARDLHLFLKNLHFNDQDSALAWFEASSFDTARAMLAETYPMQKLPILGSFTQLNENILEDFNKIFSTLTESNLARFVLNLQDKNPEFIRKTLALAIEIIEWRDDPTFSFITSITTYIKFIIKGKFKNFENFEFRGSNLLYLKEIDFSNTNLSKTKFNTAVVNCDFHNAQLKETKFLIKIENSKFQHTDLREVKFRCEYAFGNRVNFNNLPFLSAKFSTQTLVDFLMFNRPERHSIELGVVICFMRLLKHTDLTEVNFQNNALKTSFKQFIFLSFADANLEGVNLNEFNKGIDRIFSFKNANLKNASFRNANLRSINFAGANFKDCDLSTADLRLANLKETKLENVLLHANQLFQFYDQGHRDFTSISLVGQLREQLKLASLAEAALSIQAFAHLLHCDFRNFRYTDLRLIPLEMVSPYQNREGYFFEKATFDLEAHLKKDACLITRKKRSISACLFGWQDIDEFNAEEIETRNAEKIKINSRDFITAIEKFKEDKRSQLIKFAHNKALLGEEKSQIKQLIHHEAILDHLNKASELANNINHGLIAKNIFSDFMRGDYEDVAINLGFIMAGQTLAKFSKTAVLQGNVLLAHDKQLGRVLQGASPFIARGTSVFMAFDLLQQIKAFQRDDSSVLPNLIGDSIYLSLDTAEIGVEVAEVFELFEGVSAITGPIGTLIGALVFVGTNIYQLVKQIENIDAIIPLSQEEKFIEGLRGFIGLGPENTIETLLEEKQLNNRLVQQGLMYLKQHPWLQRYIFPSAKIGIADSCLPLFYKNIICLIEKLFIGECTSIEAFMQHDCNKHFQIDLDNQIILTRKRANITWGRAQPDTPHAGELICFSAEPGELAPASFYCKNAIGIADKTIKPRNVTFIDVGEGEDQVLGFMNSPNIIAANNGLKSLEGGDQDDLFILQGNSISGYIDGGEGINTLELADFAKAQQRLYVNIEYNYLGNETYDYTNLHIINLQRVLGRREKADTIYSACDSLYIEGRGGENRTLQDHILIPAKRCSEQPLHLVIAPNTQVENHALQGNFSYFFPRATGIAQLALHGGYHRVFFNYTLQELERLAVTPLISPELDDSKTHFYFSAQKTLDVSEANIAAKKFNITLQDGNAQITYVLNDKTEIKRGKQHIYIMQGSQLTVKTIVQNYPAIANKLNCFIVVHALAFNEIIMIGHGQHDILSNDPIARKSHLIGNAGENIYLINPPTENKTRIDVMLYRVHNDSTIDTLDLRPVTHWLHTLSHRKPDLFMLALERDLRLILHAKPPGSDPQSHPLIRITLKNALATDWYKYLHVIQDHAPLRITRRNWGPWAFVPEPLIIDASKKIIVISAHDVEKNTRVIISQRMGSLSYIRDGEELADLIITNVASKREEDFCTLILKDFYRAIDLHTLILQFADQTVTLMSELPRIRQAPALQIWQNQTKAAVYQKVFAQNHLAKQRSKRQVLQEDFPTVANTASSLSSWIGNGIKWFRHLSAQLSSSTVMFASSSTSRPYTHQYAEKIIPHDANPTNPMLEIGDYCVWHLEKQGLLQLLDLFVRKCTGQKPRPGVKDISICQTESLAKASALRLQFEHAIKFAANASGLAYRTVEASIKFSELENELAKALYRNPLTDLQPIFTKNLNNLTLPIKSTQVCRFQNALRDKLRKIVQLGACEPAQRYFSGRSNSFFFTKQYSLIKQEHAHAKQERFFRVA
jgi:uncharacterized protein YjbI with pentapeptide repeats